MHNLISGLICLILSVPAAFAQKKALVNTSNSSFTRLTGIDMGDVQWTRGFWAERFNICKDSMVPHLWQTYTDPDISHAFKNFEIAAGLDTGSHEGPSFHDGDFYKTLEAVASLYASTKDKKLDDLMDKAIEVIALSQREDGYLYTPAMIEQRKTGIKSQFEDRLSFEAYNLGHLMTAACVHYRATGKTSLLNIAKKATDYLCQFYKKASPALARNAICPSHYMGVVEMYRTTHDPAYLELAKHLIDIKGKIEDGTDDNQDRVPFRQQTKAMGHAVRANYLYAGVADVYAESGEDSLLNCLTKIWKDLVNTKMYITGGCGALYDGVSPYGTSYDPSQIQEIHQAFGRHYQLPNMTAHNETCANIGNMLFNWRMLGITGDAKYADVLELALYNSVLSGISLDGNKFFYTNPLSASDNFPYDLRWSGGRQRYISLSNCCPPNVVRTISEVSDYTYSISDKGLWINLYGSNTLSTTLKDGSAVKLDQETNYPWDGVIKIIMQQAPSKTFSLFLRIPGWSTNATLLVNGKPVSGLSLNSGQYVEVQRKWSKGDVITLHLPMPVTLVEANPLVEETRNQVAVKRGPLVYCLESVDLPKDKSVFDIVMPAQPDLQAKHIVIDNSDIVCLEGEARLENNSGWENKLYRVISTDVLPAVKVRLIPYYAWSNRGHSEMTVWMPLSR